MCIKTRPDETQQKPLSVDAMKAVIPQGTFTAYKIVRFSEGKLVSPVYHKEWNVGEHVGGKDEFNDQTGIYAFLAKIDPVVLKDNERILSLQVHSENVTASGYDEYGKVSGTAVVASKVTVTQEAFDAAMNVAKLQAEVQETLTKAKPEVLKNVRKAVKKAGEVKEKEAKKVAKIKAKVSKKILSAKKVVDKLASMTVSQLRVIAKTKKIVGFSKMNKTDLLAALKKK